MYKVIRLWTVNGRVARIERKFASRDLMNLYVARMLDNPATLCVRVYQLSGADFTFLAEYRPHANSPR